MQQKYVIGGVVVLVLIGLVVWFSKHDGRTQDGESANITAPTEDPVDVTLDFYQAWLETQTNPEAAPSVAELLASDAISDAVRSYVTEQEDEGVEPILCQSATPERIRAQLVSADDTTAQIQIFARGEGLVPGEYALVDLKAVNGQWQIDQIDCFSGESAPEREFPFDQRGQLLKSVPPPLDSNVWHLVFVENEQPRVIPLMFAADSVCVAADGSETTCDQTSFQEAATVTAKGDMSESGPTIKRLEFAL